MSREGVGNVTTTEERQIVSAYVNGATYAEISERFKRSYGTIGNVIRRSGVRRKPSQPATPAPLTELQRLRIENSRRQQRFYSHNYLGCFR